MKNVLLSRYHRKKLDINDHKERTLIQKHVSGFCFHFLEVTHYKSNICLPISNKILLYNLI